MKLTRRSLKPSPVEPLWTKFRNTPPDGMKHLRVKLLINNYLLSHEFRKLKPSSQKIYFSVIDQFEDLLLYTGKTFLETNAHTIDYQMTEYLKDVLLHKYTESTLGSYFKVMNAVWRFGMRRSMVFMNPWDKPGLSRAQERDTTWTPEQVELAYETAKTKGFNTLAMYLILAYETAQRPWRDLRDLKWESVREIEQDGKRRLVFDFVISKTNTHIILPLSDRVIDLLDNRSRLDSYVFSEAKGKRLSAVCMQQQLEVVKREAKLPRELQFRDFRRTAITELAEAGCTTREIEAITGWRVSEAVIHRYARVRYKTALNAQAKRDALHANTTVSTITQY